MCSARKTDKPLLPARRQERWSLKARSVTLPLPWLLLQAALATLAVSCLQPSRAQSRVWEDLEKNGPGRLRHATSHGAQRTRMAVRLGSHLIETALRTRTYTRVENAWMNSDAGRRRPALSSGVAVVSTPVRPTGCEGVAVRTKARFGSAPRVTRDLVVFGIGIGEVMTDDGHPFLNHSVIRPTGGSQRADHFTLLN